MIKDKIKSGFLYGIEGHNILTGCEGAKNIVDMFQREGFSDEYIGDIVYILDIGSNISAPLNNITWNKKHE